MKIAISRKKFYAFLGAALFTLSLGLIMIQERLIFFPEKLAPTFKFNFPQSEEKNFEFEGLRINSLYFPKEKAKNLLLYFHGNAGSLSSWGHTAAQLRDELGENVWIVDYPGYGKSEGTISSERQLLSLAEAFYAEAKRSYPDKRIVLYGRSIGSGPAAWVAAQKKAPLILETPYASFSKLAKEIAPWFPGFLRRYNFETTQWLKNFSQPLLILHGDGDEVIPVAHARNLHKVFPAANYTEIPGASHNNLSEQPAFWAALQNFVKQKL